MNLYDRIELIYSYWSIFFMFNDLIFSKIYNNLDVDACIPQMKPHDDAPKTNHLLNNRLESHSHHFINFSSSQFN